MTPAHASVRHRPHSPVPRSDSHLLSALAWAGRVVRSGGFLGCTDGDRFGALGRGVARDKSGGGREHERVVCITR
jgi:hypothetical protein